MLNESDESVPTDGPIEQLVDSCRQGAFPDLDADEVDVIDGAGIVDPSFFFATEVAACLCEPHKLFSCCHNRFTTSARFSDKDLLEYHRLACRQLRSGTLDLECDLKATANVFAVGKKSSSKLREVWNGAHISALAIKPPCPPSPANPAALGELLASTDRPLLASCRSTLSFF